ncbi:hypothetical protein [Curtobacterium sp. ISL-83]|uniref:hypothetical protein n=1 Tax=Curtobacterium sp. ISL-83 TaxID=2819145 RepID=UPI001BEBFA85|nr:hypothetical protein [Curtobacterium sp. ISL-83]MBT2501355.1 hypothetical protein [Curtobacterium sp. ISL-83]
MEFAEVARELLLVAPADFVRERTARQRATRGADRALATAIGKLRKPAPAAWVIDLLAHEGALDDAVALGPALREAQASADPGQIATLRRQRSQVIDALAQAGAALAEDAGHPLTPAVLDQVRATIESGMADPHAGAAIRSGLLLRALESVGFEDVDLDDALADPDAVPEAWRGSDAPPIPITAAKRARRRSRATGPSRGTDAATTAPADEPSADAEPAPDAEPPRADDAQPDDEPPLDRGAARAAETAARRASREADTALDDAEYALEAAEERRADLEHRHDDLARRHDDLERELRALERQQQDLEDEQAALTTETERLERARDDAEAVSDRARDDLDAARRARRPSD